MAQFLYLAIVGNAQPAASCKYETLVGSACRSPSATGQFFSTILTFPTVAKNNASDKLTMGAHAFLISLFCLLAVCFIYHSHHVLDGAFSGCCEARVSDLLRILIMGSLCH